MGALVVCDAVGGPVLVLLLVGKGTARERGEAKRKLCAFAHIAQYAHRFMQIGESLNHHNCGDLPKAVATLYELSRMDPSDIEHGIQYAHKFMRIGANLNQHNCADLPKAVATLYELSRMDPDDIEDGNLKSC